jgi:AcrR family transcriptional regulator
MIQDVNLTRDGAAPTSRRAEYAQLTREGILNAARDLFVRKGYFATTVDEIARAARVASATVYAVGGGKHGLLKTLISAGTHTKDIAQTLARIESATDPRELLTFVIHSTRATFEEWSGLMRQVAAAAPQEPTVRESMHIAHDSMRAGLALTARQLARMGSLRDGMNVTKATDVLWLHLCNSAYFIRTDDLGWSLDESEAWLNDTLPCALLRLAP